MTTVDVMTTRIAQGDSKPRTPPFAYNDAGLPHVDGTFVTAAGFVPIGFAQSAAGEYTFSILRRCDHRAVRFRGSSPCCSRRCWVWRFSGRRSPRCGRAERGRCGLPQLPGRRDEGALDHHCGDLGQPGRRILALPFVPRQFFPASDRPELVVAIRYVMLGTPGPLVLLGAGPPRCIPKAAAPRDSPPAEFCLRHGIGSAHNLPGPSARSSGVTPDPPGGRPAELTAAVFPPGIPPARSAHREEAASSRP